MLLFGHWVCDRTVLPDFDVALCAPPRPERSRVPKTPAPKRTKPLQKAGAFLCPAQRPRTISGTALEGGEARSKTGRCGDRIILSLSLLCRSRAESPPTPLAAKKLPRANALAPDEPDARASVATTAKTRQPAHHPTTTDPPKGGTTHQSSTLPRPPEAKVKRSHRPSVKNRKHLIWVVHYFRLGGSTSAWRLALESVALPKCSYGIGGVGPVGACVAPSASACH